MTKRNILNALTVIREQIAIIEHEIGEGAKVAGDTAVLELRMDEFFQLHLKKTGVRYALLFKNGASVCDTKECPYKIVGDMPVSYFVANCRESGACRGGGFSHKGVLILSEKFKEFNITWPKKP